MWVIMLVLSTRVNLSEQNILTAFHGKILIVSCTKKSWLISVFCYGLKHAKSDCLYWTDGEPGIPRPG